MWINLSLAVGSATGAIVLFSSRSFAGVAGIAFGLLSIWQLYSAMSQRRRFPSPVILRLGGFSWTLEGYASE